MPFDATRVKNNPGEIQQHFTDFAAGVTSVDSWMVHEEGRGYVIVTIEYTA
ncbi:hypothetical protein [Haladaptatus salinisoli]|uniref:hypothetical protein n=1 Tax=Haladaptatus salinisoli TaxID=2884876 RepID=UPI001D0B6CD4|nr:hypothetical protein [Haladaptatus salinisoli]